MAVVTCASSVSLAKDYQCRLKNGCVAYKGGNGVVKAVKFRKGDWISTRDGWFVNPNTGWKKHRPMGQAGLGK